MRNESAKLRTTFGRAERLGVDKACLTLTSDIPVTTASIFLVFLKPHNTRHPCSESGPSSLYREEMQVLQGGP
jgi:hypothetical protein